MITFKTSEEHIERRMSTASGGRRPVVNVRSDASRSGKSGSSERSRLFSEAGDMKSFDLQLLTDPEDEKRKARRVTTVRHGSRYVRGEDWMSSVVDGKESST